MIKIHFKNILQSLVIGFSCLIIFVIIWNAVVFFNIFKNEERLKMNLWAAAQKSMINADLTKDNIDLNLEIFSNNKTIPLILTENGKIINTNNIEEEITKNPKKLNKYLEDIKTENEPIVIEYVPNKFLYLYYGNSYLLNKLQYYPIALVLIILFYIALIFSYYRISVISNQNKLWTGMAKETAHQLGTPLSSLLGWVENLREDEKYETIAKEIEKDVFRLQMITDRFSKIGSTPVLNKMDVVNLVQQNVDYIKNRYRNIEITFFASQSQMFVHINETLFGWTIENLLKNAIDAIKGRGQIEVSLHSRGKEVWIKVADNGSGMPKSLYKKIFEPGFTTKKRGWGLGLSLTKRIVNDFFGGNIQVLKSELGVGTTFLIRLPKAKLG